MYKHIYLIRIHISNFIYIKKNLDKLLMPKKIFLIKYELKDFTTSRIFKNITIGRYTFIC